MTNDSKDAEGVKSRMQEHYARRYHEQVDQIVIRLRDIADEVERDGHRVGNKVGSPPFSWAAHNVVHSVLWGLANLSLDNFTMHAAEVDALAADTDGQ